MRKHPKKAVRAAVPGLKAPFLVADFASMEKTPCPCGASRRAFIQEDNRVCSVHVVDISTDSQTHYHKGFTETYYVLEGEGRLELDGQSLTVRAGMAVMIRPGTRHRAVPGPSGLRILNIVVPPFDPRDEWHD